MNITIYRKPYENEVFEKFLENVFDLELKYLASDLTSYGFSFSKELLEAIERAVQVCHAAHVPVKQNFKPVYIGKKGQVICDWRLSPLGRKLVILNANPTNPLVAKLQLELLKKL